MIYLIYKLCIHIHYLYFTKPTNINNIPIITINKPDNTVLTSRTHNTALTHNTTLTSRTNLSILSPKIHTTNTPIMTHRNNNMLLIL